MGLSIDHHESGNREKVKVPPPPLWTGHGDKAIPTCKAKCPLEASDQGSEGN